MPTPTRDVFTGDLFGAAAPLPVVEGGLNFAIQLCGVLSHMITEAIGRKVIRSRYDLAARMSELTGEEITKAMIDSWTAESKDRHRFPLEYTPAFEVACDSHDLQRLICSKRDTALLVGDERELATLGRTVVEKVKINEEERRLKARLTRGKR